MNQILGSCQAELRVFFVGGRGLGGGVILCTSNNGCRQIFAIWDLPRRRPFHGIDRRQRGPWPAFEMNAVFAGGASQRYEVP